MAPRQFTLDDLIQMLTTTRDRIARFGDAEQAIETLEKQKGSLQEEVEILRRTAKEANDTATTEVAAARKKLAADREALQQQFIEAKDAHAKQLLALATTEKQAQMEHKRQMDMRQDELETLSQYCRDTEARLDTIRTNLKQAQEQAAKMAALQ